MKLNFIFLSLLLLLTSLAHAKFQIQYLGKPIDSLCFFNLEEVVFNVNLKSCGKNSNHYQSVSQNNILVKEGFTGYDWVDPETKLNGYSYYKAWQAAPNQYWVYTINNGGGSGEFTALYRAQQKNKHTLTLKEILGGDRCNGGINDVSLINNELTVITYLTTYDFVTYGDPHLLLKPYDDLANCAACCVAKATYTLNLTNQKPKLKYVEWTNQDTNVEPPDQGHFSKCFKNLYKDALSHHQTRFTEQSLEQFVKLFKTKCLKK